MTKKEILTILTDNKSFIKQKFEVDKIGLFGSYAKDKQTEESDIDIYVEFKHKTFDNLAGLWNYLEELYQKKIDLGFDFAPAKPYEPIAKGSPVYDHWETITAGNIPFGYRLNEEAD